MVNKNALFLGGFVSFIIAFYLATNIIRSTSIEPLCAPVSTKPVATATSILTSPSISRAAERVPLCFINSAFGKDAKDLDKPIDMTNLSNDSRFAFLFFTNQADIQVPGWTTILLTDLPFRRLITQSRWPKFQAEKHPFVDESCDMVLYFDVSAGLKQPMEEYLALAAETQVSDLGLAQARHSLRESISSEFSAILENGKDVDRNTIASETWLTQQDDFENHAQVWLNTFLMYDPHNEKLRHVKDFFWKRYSQELDSWRDQPLWAYSLHHFNATPYEILPDHWVEYIRIGARKTGGHKYSLSNDCDAN